MQVKRIQAISIKVAALQGRLRNINKLKKGN